MLVLTLNYLHDIITGSQIMKKVMKMLLVPPLLIFDIIKLTLCAIIKYQ